MKTKAKYVSLVVVAAVAGAAFFSLSKTSFSAVFQSDLAVAVVTAAAIVGFAARDYSRRMPSLSASRATILRPALRLDESRAGKTPAYGVKSVRAERIAA